jgi:ADP-ribose pyrophosphatase
MERWVQREEIYRGRIFSVWGGKVTLDTGEQTIREIVQHPGGVAIVPVVDEGLILISQFRIAIGRELVELPAGRLEPGEDPESCARRELEEEIGYRPGKLILLARYFSSAGFTDEGMYIFLAGDLEKTTPKLETDERIRQVLVPIEGIEAKLDAQEFEDAKTIIGLREFLAYRRRGGA